MLRATLRNPHVPLVAGAAGVLLVEFFLRPLHDPPSGEFAIQAAIAAACLACAWLHQERIRLLPLLALALLFQLGWIAIDLKTSVPLDHDPSVYATQGHALLHGTYPHSEYPPGAVLLFAAGAFLEDHGIQHANALLMVPFQLLSVACIWLLAPRRSAWLAAFVAFWPLNAYFWQFRFDLAPTGLLALGLLLGSRRRWSWSGLALGLGAAVKWIPALSCAAFVVWLCAARRWRTAAAHLASFLLSFLLIELPFLLWAPASVAAAFQRQGGRGVSAESLWYLPLHALGLAHPGRYIFGPAHVPGGTRLAVVVVQALLLLGLLASAARRRRTLPEAISIAALLPVAFFLTNRIFSPQFLILLLVAWAIAAALVIPSRRGQLGVALIAAAATFADFFVYPATTYPLWQLGSAVLFVAGFGLTGWLLRPLAKNTRRVP